MANSKSAKEKGSKGQDSDRLPFEPKGSKKKTASAPKIPAQKKKDKAPASRDEGIPEVVSKRMAKRMAVFSGIPTLLGLMTFPISYYVMTKEILDLPNSAVLLFSLLFLGLGVAGLSYGVVSASWDEADPGSLLGIQEFQVNIKRLFESWQAKS